MKPRNFWWKKSSIDLADATAVKQAAVKIYHAAINVCIRVGNSPLGTSDEAVILYLESSRDELNVAIDQLKAKVRIEP